MEEKQKLNKRQVLLIVLGIAILIVLVVGVTYAYFQSQLDDGANANVDVDTDIPDNLVFDVNKDIGITITQFNFGPNAGNKSDSAIASASLTANSTNNTATYTYYVYFKINNNNYVYTTADQKPEIILTVTDPTGAPVTSIDGLTYNQELGGFDITTANGTFAVASEYTITSNSSVKPTVQEWEFTATFINLDTDQGDNAGKNMNAEIIIQREEIQTLAEYVISQYTTDGVNGLYYHDADLANGAGDNSYRYAGANPNNYVCFGSTENPCPENNLYRIIGVFGNEVKLIKADYTTTTMTGSGGDYYGAYSFSTSNYKGSMNTSNIAIYYWNNNTQTNTWSESRLNTTNLNSSYISYIGTTWSNKIATHTWYVGGYSTNSATPKTFYNAESSGTTYSAKIGLMYASDYGYAASNSYWTTNMGSYSSARNNNWMYMGLYEWTISRDSSDSDDAFRVYDTGDLNYTHVYFSHLAVRPSFYLNSNVEYNGGTGTESDPFTLVV